MDALFLSRLQFAMTSMFHYIYPPLSIGVGVILVIMEGLYVKTKNPLYKKAAKFWANIFALIFALGVATGLVQVFGFGTNWSQYSRFVGDVFGSVLASEGIFAFFLEAGFLGIMLFGWERVSAKIHYLATCLVTFGAHFSALWIVIANSWMQTPAGHKIVGEGSAQRAVVENFWQLIFNPSSVDRVVHVLLGCWLAGMCLVISISAYYFLKKKHLPFARVSMKIGLIMTLVTLGLQLLSADSTARGVAQNQPSKFAAMEGVYKTEPYTGINLVGWVDEKEGKVWGIKIPGLLSFLSYHDFETPVKGFDQIPADERPPIQITFQAYHLMVMMWGVMVLMTLWALYLWKKGKLEKATFCLKLLVGMVICPQIANQVGWVTAEVGRQPWIVYGLLKTKEGVSPFLTGEQVMFSLIMLFFIYITLLALFLFLLDRKIRQGPEETANLSDSVVYQDPYTQKGGV